MHQSYRTVRNQRGYDKKKLEESVPLSTDQDKDQIRKIGALLRFYFHLDPTVLTDEEYVNHWNELDYCLKFEQNRIKNQSLG